MQNYKLHLWYLSLQFKQKIECVCVCAFSQSFIHRTHMDLLDKVGLAMKFPQCLASSKRPLKKHSIIWRYYDIVSNPWECSSNRGIRWWWLKMMACFYLKQKLQNMFFFSKTPQRFPCFLSTPGFSTPTPQHLPHPTVWCFPEKRPSPSRGKSTARRWRKPRRGGWEANSTPWN